MTNVSVLGGGAFGTSLALYSHNLGHQTRIWAYDEGLPERVAAKGGTREEQISALERECVLVSLNNLMTFPFVQERVEAEDLALHGLWMDIRGGGLETYNPKSDNFEQI